MVLVESYLIGLITSASYDFIRKRLDSSIEKTFSSVYEESVKTLVASCGKKKSKQFIKRFLNDLEIKKIACDPLAPREKFRRLVKSGESLKNPSEKDLPVRKILEDFYTIFSKKINSNQKLANRLGNIYSSIMIDICKKTGEKMDKVYLIVSELKKQHDQLKKDLSKMITEDGKVVIIQEEVGGFPMQIPAVQFRVKGFPLSYIKNNVTNFFCFSKEDLRIVSDKEDFIELEYTPNKNDNIIRLDYNQIPYKIIYPPFNKIVVYIEWKKIKGDWMIQATIFSSYKGPIRRLEHIIFGDIDPRKIEEVCFRKKMKVLAKKFLSEITVFDYDPLIYKQVVNIEGVNTSKKGTKMIAFGERGFFLRPELCEILKGTKIVKKDQKTDIFFLRIKDTKKISEKNISYLDIDFRGKVVGHFSRGVFEKGHARKILISFFEKYGIPITDRSKIHF